jgi:prepilin-type N-terminal cleavage/methylation domain-containing protein
MAHFIAEILKDAQDRGEQREAKSERIEFNPKFNELYLTPQSSILSPRPAFTLLELLLVLALLVVLAGLAMPLFEGSFTSLKLRRATDQVLAVWIQARTAAIESGQLHQFRFQTDSGDYLVEPWPRDEEFSVTPAADNDSMHKGFQNIRREDGALLVRDRLPQGILLKRGERAIRGSAQGEPSTSEVESLTAGNTTTGPYGIGWSAPVLFHPDGTTNDVSLLLSNGQQQYQRATLRSLTGTGRSSKIIPASELNR